MCAGMECVRRRSVRRTDGIELRWSGEKLMLSAGTSAAPVERTAATKFDFRPGLTDLLLVAAV